MDNECKRCLLLDAGNSITHSDIMQQLHMLDDGMLCDDTVYQNRLVHCRRCDHLISGVCRKCGCYVEYRAGIKNQHCPNTDDKKW